MTPVKYRVTVRRGPKVSHASHDSLDDALTELEAAARTTPRKDRVEFLGRSYDPVAVRVELKGSGTRAGLDVRGDGTMIGWTGRVRRRLIDAEPGESAIAALRRTVTT